VIYAWFSEHARPAPPLAENPDDATVSICCCGWWCELYRVSTRYGYVWTLTRQRRRTVTEAVKYRNHGDNDDRINAVRTCRILPEHPRAHLQLGVEMGRITKLSDYIYSGSKHRGIVTLSYRNYKTSRGFKPSVSGNTNIHIHENYDRIWFINTIHVVLKRLLHKYANNVNMGKVHL